MALSNNENAAELTTALNAISSPQSTMPQLAFVEALSTLLYPSPGRGEQHTLSSSIPPPSVAPSSLSLNTDPAASISQPLIDQPTPKPAQPTTSSCRNANKPQNKMPISASKVIRTPTMPANTDSVAPDMMVAKAEIPDDDVVLLDKANVNPLAFRRRHKKHKPPKGAMLPPARIIPSPQKNQDENAEPRLYAIVMPTGTSRKRTLSEIMDERDRERERSRKRSYSEPEEYARNRTHPGACENVAPLTSNIPCSTTAAHHGTASSPCRRSPRLQQCSTRPSTAPNVQKRKPYQMPEWARTETATVPRFAEGFVRKESARVGPMNNRGRSKRRSHSRIEFDDNPFLDTDSPNSSSSTSVPIQKTGPSARALPERRLLPSLPSSEPDDAFSLPVVLGSDIPVFESPSSRPSTPPICTRTKLPSTPQQLHHIESESSPTDGVSPLFTPVPPPSAFTLHNTECAETAKPA